VNIMELYQDDHIVCMNNSGTHVYLMYVARDGQKDDEKGRRARTLGFLHAALLHRALVSSETGAEKSNVVGEIRRWMKETNAGELFLECLKTKGWNTTSLEFLEERVARVRRS